MLYVLFRLLLAPSPWHPPPEKWHGGGTARQRIGYIYIYIQREGEREIEREREIHIIMHSKACGIVKIKPKISSQ